MLDLHSIWLNSYLSLLNPTVETLYTLHGSTGVYLSHISEVHCRNSDGLFEHNSKYGANILVTVNHTYSIELYGIGTDEEVIRYSKDLINRVNIAKRLYNTPKPRLKNISETWNIYPSNNYE